MSISIRPAVTADLDAIAQLYDDLNDYLAAHGNPPHWKKGVYPIRSHAEDALSRGELYVAVIDSTIAGTVVYSPEQGEVYKTVSWGTDFDVPVIVICKLAVHPAFLGCGVGAKLLDYAAEVGAGRGVKAVRLDVYEENLPAIRLYEKCGFQYRGTVDLGLEKLYGLKWYKVFEKLVQTY
ncbi:MAG: GNAT family N-acetyltransferase [Ruminococcaceae bacterium]|nr:GNAT family N-acetyltransferase [Oscillospiraceae bacterium]